jgi:hypothetical protein
VILYKPYVTSFQPSVAFDPFFRDHDRTFFELNRSWLQTRYDVMALVPEGINENGPTEINNPISIQMEFSPSPAITIRTVLSSFLDTLSQVDELATLYSSKQTQFYQTSKDLTKGSDTLRSYFPVRQFQCGRRNIAILRATLSSRSTLS